MVLSSPVLPQGPNWQSLPKPLCMPGLTIDHRLVDVLSFFSFAFARHAGCWWRRGEKITTAVFSFFLSVFAFFFSSFRNYLYTDEKTSMIRSRRLIFSRILQTTRPPPSIHGEFFFIPSAHLFVGFFGACLRDWKLEYWFLLWHASFKTLIDRVKYFNQPLHWYYHSKPIPHPVSTEQTEWILTPTLSEPGNNWNRTWLTWSRVVCAQGCFYWRSTIVVNFALSAAVIPETGIL